MPHSAAPGARRGVVGHGSAQRRGAEGVRACALGLRGATDRGTGRVTVRRRLSRSRAPAPERPCRSRSRRPDLEDEAEEGSGVGPPGPPRRPRCGADGGGAEAARDGRWAGPAAARTWGSARGPGARSPGAGSEGGGLLAAVSEPSSRALRGAGGRGRVGERAAGLNDSIKIPAPAFSPGRTGGRDWPRVSLW